MAITLTEKMQQIKNKCLTINSTNVSDIFLTLTKEEYVGIHGPEHHLIDGACVLTAYKNGGGEIDLANALDQLEERAAKMPGAMCGHWGVCGAVTSVGAALAIIDGTGPISSNDWGEHMQLTASILAQMAEISGPRCCKRDGYLSLKKAVEYVNSHYNIHIDWTKPVCSYSERNMQCLKENCPFHR